MNLQDAKILVTGGSDRIGLETARFLKEAGARVAICGRNPERLEAAARESAKHFVAQEHGTIINVGSVSGLRGVAEQTAYAASKFALRGMTQVWRAELRKHNVRVSYVAPSEVITDF